MMCVGQTVMHQWPLSTRYTVGAHHWVLLTC